MLLKLCDCVLFVLYIFFYFNQYGFLLFTHPFTSGINRNIRLININVAKNILYVKTCTFLTLLLYKYIDFHVIVIYFMTNSLKIKTLNQIHTSTKNKHFIFYV